jgi:hypothetical protein
MQPTYPSFAKLAHDAKSKPSPAGRDYAKAAADAAASGSLVFAETHAGTFVHADGAPVPDAYSYLVVQPKPVIVRP